MSKKNISSSDLLTVQQAADFLGVNPGTIRRWAQNKELPGLKIGVRGDWRFSKEDIMHMAHSDSSKELLLQTHQTPEVVNNDIPNLDWSIMNTTDHFVQFYDSEAFLIESLSGFISTGLRRGEVCIVIATEEHGKSLDEQLKKVGLDPDAAHARGIFISLDASETLAQFMVDGLPDKELFYQSVGSIIQHAAESGFGIQAFGEMVALLWASGNHAGAIQLEKLWNGLAEKYLFTLFCAYPMNGFNSRNHAELFNEISHTHSKVIPSESYASLNTPDARMREIALLQQKSKSLEAEIAKRKKIERQKDEFMALASHELKTPVTSMKAYAQVLQKQFEQEGNMRSAQQLGKMNMQINKLTLLIHDLLDISKIEGGQLQFRQEAFTIDDLIHETIEELQRTTKKHTIVKKGTSKNVITGDRDRIGQVITNLLTNAIKYSPEADTINVSISQNSKNIVVSVQDFGLGIEPCEQTNIFKRFYREPGVLQETFPGLGVGLYIAAKIIRRHNGEIWVNSEKGKGSTFSFSLPL